MHIQFLGSQPTTQHTNIPNSIPTFLLPTTICLISSQALLSTLLSTLSNKENIINPYFTPFSYEHFYFKHVLPSYTVAIAFSHHLQLHIVTNNSVIYAYSLYHRLSLIQQCTIYILSKIHVHLKYLMKSKHPLFVHPLPESILSKFCSLLPLDLFWSQFS